MAYVLASIRIVVGAVLVAAAIAKAADPSRSRDALVEFLPVLDRIAPMLVRVIPTLELSLGTALVLGVAPRLVAAVAVGLLCCFTGVLAWRATQEPEARCPCFGNVSAGPIGARTFLRNASLIAGCLVVAVWGPGAFALLP